MAAIFAEERLATGGCPLNGGQQQTVAASQSEQLLFGAGAKALFTDNLTAISFHESRRDNFSSAGGASIDQHDHRALKNCRLGSAVKRFQRFPFAAEVCARAPSLMKRFATATASVN